MFRIIDPQILGLIAITFSLSYVVYFRFCHALSDVPGPFLASISHLWLAYRVVRGDILEHLTSLHNKHGKCINFDPLNSLMIPQNHADSLQDH